MAETQLDGWPGLNGWQRDVYPEPPVGEAGDGRRRPAGGGVPSDGLARGQWPPERQAEDQASCSRSSLSEAVERFLGEAVDGIIVIAPETSAVEALTALAIDIPLVAVGCGSRAPLPSVAIDNLSGAAQATRHLLDLGHET